MKSKDPRMDSTPPQIVRRGRLAIGLLGTLLFVGLTGAAVVQFGQQSETVYDARAYNLAIPEGGVTPEDWFAVLGALENGDPLPQGFSISNKWGQVKTVLSGLSDPATGDVHAVTTIIDRSEELGTATYFVDGQVVLVATRENGRVTDRSGHAIATLSAWVPPSTGHVHTIEWISVDGQRTQTHSLDLQ